MYSRYISAGLKIGVSARHIQRFLKLGHSSQLKCVSAMPTWWCKSIMQTSPLLKNVQLISRVVIQVFSIVGLHLKTLDTMAENLQFPYK